MACWRRSPNPIARPSSRPSSISPADGPARAIQEYKNPGGWNNDWALSQKLAPIWASKSNTAPWSITSTRSSSARWRWLIRRESWFPRDGLLERLAANAIDLAIFTGRTCATSWTSRCARFAADLRFDPDHLRRITSRSSSPHPTVSRMIMAQEPGKQLLYVGDTVDDARSASSAPACRSSASPRRRSRAADLLICSSRNAPSRFSKTSTKSRSAVRNASLIARIRKKRRSAGSLGIEGRGTYDISTGIRFFDHMLELFAKHGGFRSQAASRGRSGCRSASHRGRRRHRAGPAFREGARRPPRHQSRGLFRAAHG